MFRGKESSNRIELSRLVQDLLNFGVSGSLRLWGWGSGWMGVRGDWGCPPHMCTCTHAHAHTCTRGKHDNFMQMASPLGEYLGIPYDVICSCMFVHACACACVWDAPSHHPPPPSTHPLPPVWGTPRIIQNSIALELIEIFQFCLKI